MRKLAALIGAIALPMFASATVYNGNGAGGFGGAVGTGNLAVTDNGTNVTFTFNRGAGQMNDDLVIYIDSTAGGITDTSPLADNGDGGRTAISGYNGGNPSRTLAVFPNGFSADHFLSIENGFIGLFGYGFNPILNYIDGAGQSGNNQDASYSLTVPKTELGLNNASTGFDFVGSYISTSAYRSNETIGASVTVPGDGAGNAGFNNSQSFSVADHYSLSAVPEPGTLSLLGVGVMAAMARRRRA